MNQYRYRFLIYLRFIFIGKIIGGEVIENGHMRVPDGPGLGVEPNWEALGQPVFTYSDNM